MHYHQPLLSSPEDVLAPFTRPGSAPPDLQQRLPHESLEGSEPAMGSEHAYLKVKAPFQSAQEAHDTSDLEPDMEALTISPSPFLTFRSYARKMLQKEGYSRPSGTLLSKVWLSMSVKEREPWKVMAVRTRESSAPPSSPGSEFHDSPAQPGYESSAGSMYGSLERNDTDVEEMTMRMHRIVLADLPRPNAKTSKMVITCGAVPLPYGWRKKERRERRELLARRHMRAQPLVQGAGCRGHPGSLVTRTSADHSATTLERPVFTRRGSDISATGKRMIRPHVPTPLPLERSTRKSADSALSPLTASKFMDVDDDYNDTDYDGDHSSSPVLSPASASTPDSARSFGSRRCVGSPEPEETAQYAVLNSYPDSMSPFVDTPLSAGSAAASLASSTELDQFQIDPDTGRVLRDDDEERIAIVDSEHIHPHHVHNAQTPIGWDTSSPDNSPTNHNSAIRAGTGPGTWEYADGDQSPPHESNRPFFQLTETETRSWQRNPNRRIDFTPIGFMI